MGKKKHYDYRAKQAHQRNIERAEANRRAKKRDEFIAKYKKHMIIGAVALAVLITVIALVSTIMSYAGSLTNIWGQMSDVEPNWIVTNLSEDKNSRYYKLGEYATPEGYTLDPEFVVSSDAKGQTLFYNADDENALVDHVFVSGVKNITAAEQIAAIKENTFFEKTSEEGVKIGDYTVHYAYFVFNETADGDEVEIGSSGLNMYVDTIHNSCVVVQLNSAGAMPLTDVPTQEQLLAEAERFLSLLTLPE